MKELLLFWFFISVPLVSEEVPPAIGRAVVWLLHRNGEGWKPASCISRRPLQRRAQRDSLLHEPCNLPGTLLTPLSLPSSLSRLTRTSLEENSKILQMAWSLWKNTGYQSHHTEVDPLTTHQGQETTNPLLSYTAEIWGCLLHQLTGLILTHSPR